MNKESSHTYRHLLAEANGLRKTSLLSPSGHSQRQSAQGKDYHLRLEILHHSPIMFGKRYIILLNVMIAEKHLPYKQTQPITHPQNTHKKKDGYRIKSTSIDAYHNPAHVIISSYQGLRHTIPSSGGDRIYPFHHLLPRHPK